MPGGSNVVGQLDIFVQSNQAQVVSEFNQTQRAVQKTTSVVEKNNGRVVNSNKRVAKSNSRLRSSFGQVGFRYRT